MSHALCTSAIGLVVILCLPACSNSNSSGRNAAGVTGASLECSSDGSEFGPPLVDLCSHPAFMCRPAAVRRFRDTDGALAVRIPGPVGIILTLSALRTHGVGICR
jgi:hypothetical protein